MGASVLAVVAVTTFWAAIRSPARSAPPEEAETPDSEEETLPASMAREQTRVTTPRLATAEPATTLAASGASERRDPDERAGERDTAASLQAAQNQRFERATQEFLGQRRDPAWAPRAEDATRRALTGRLAGANLSDVVGDIQCRASWCAVDLANSGATDLSLVDRAIGDVAAELAATEGRVLESRLSATSRDGRVRARYYLRFSRS